MAQTWQVIRGSTTYTVSGGTYSWRVSAIGVGAPPKRNLSIRGPFQDGATPTGFRYDPRVLSLVFYSDAASLSLADARRDDIYNIWKGIEGQSVKVRVTRDDGSVRQIDGEVVGVLDMPDEIGDRLGTGQRFAVQLECHNPFWYNPTQTTATLTALTNTWQTGGGLIASGNVKEYGTNTAAGAGLATTLAAAAPFTVFIQENAATLTNDAYLFWLSDGIEYKRAFAQNNSGSFYLGNQSKTGFLATGNRTYYVVGDGANVSIYRDNVLIGDGLSYTGGITAGYSFWGADAFGLSQWPTSLDKTAIYDKALSSVERAGIESVLAGNYGTTLTVTYAGQVRAYPVVELTATGINVTNPTIQNTTTGDKLEFAYTLASGATIVVDCRYGYKTVKLQSTSATLIDKLTSDSDLATFAILSPGEVSGGVNLFSVTAGLTATLKYNTQYLGL